MDLLSIKRKLLPLSGPQDMGGGGGGGSTGTQTNITELPEWARGYAKNTLEKTAALSEKPYQAYEAPRIAGFSPMQQASQEAAANMTPNAGTGAAMGIAGEAAMRGLGTQYGPGQFQNQFQAPDPYQAGRFRADRVGTQSFTQPGAAESYMSPYMQNVVDVQQREARRASQIAGQGQQAEAVGRGAFGGSRDALMRAERERNLATQLGDIQATGQQAAFQQAQQQFNADQARRLQAQQANQQYGLQAQQLGEQSRQFGAGQGLQAAGLGAQYGQAAQQLGEQSRQFGANLGLQGLQTALTGAGQLGSLGQQQFQQGMDINKLQNAYGGQQQALRQQGMDLAYQDFLNEQNYPYKQLGFMSDMIRGLPLGQVTTQQMYQPPGSVAGQVAGIGTGLYGLSKFMAEGGLAYADGGISRALNDDGALAASMDKLTDEQLQQIIQNPTTKAQFEAAQEEMAMRASERGGMAGAFNQLPQAARETFTAANGGIVSFSNGGYYQDPMGAPSYESDGYSPFKQNVREGESYTPGLLGMLFGYNRLPAEKKTELAAAAGDKYDRGTATRREDYAGAAPKAPSAPKGSITEAAKKASAATGVPEEDFMETFRKLRGELQAESKEDMKALNDQIGKLGERSREIKDRGLGRALSEFGFNMAAAASKPGARFIGSAAQASPTLAASAARTQELADAADDNAAKMRLTMKQYEIAQRKGDTQAASQMAAQMRMLQQSEKQIALKREELAQQGAYQQGILGIQRADLARKERGDVARGLQALSQREGANARLSEVRRKAIADFESSQGRTLRKQLLDQYGDPAKVDYLYNQKKQAYVNDVLQDVKDRRADASAGVQSVYDLLNREE